MSRAISLARTSLVRNSASLSAAPRLILPRGKRHLIRPIASMTTSNRSAGSIGDAFASLSHSVAELPPRFSDLKRELVGDNGEAIVASWKRLLTHLNKETLPRVQEKSSDLIPEVDFSAIAENGGQLPESAAKALKECGTIIVRQIVPEQQALDWKQSVRDYIQANPFTKGFPPKNIQVYELYWSKAQLEARSHKNMLLTQSALNQVWKKNPEDQVVLSEPVAYCDRLRIRTPGDTSFNLGPHLDGGSLERWEDPEYRKCYTSILQGKWEDHDAFQVGPRLSAVVDMYNGPGGCSAFRSYQGWLSLSECGPTQGTLRVMPDLKASTAYTILRPFVAPRPGSWELDVTSSYFQGAAMGAGQELLHSHHPHISPGAFVSIPQVRPGDAVFWHCDVAHMVDAEHLGRDDASVFYVPAAPLCKLNARYLKRQRLNFLQSRPPPDFPGLGGLGESEHDGCGSVGDLSETGRRAMGCALFDSELAQTEGEAAAYFSANKILGWNLEEVDSK